MYVVVNKYLVPKGYAAMTLFPVVFIGDSEARSNRILLNHEKIHLRQQAELLIFPFFVWYFAEYLCRLVQYRNHDRAYRNISFEREAYRHEADSFYLQGRNIWAFVKYIKTGRP